MPFNLHPSGFCVWYSEESRKNLLKAVKCPVCNRTAGHSFSCEYYIYKEDRPTNSRGKLFDACSLLWMKNPNRSFITFTLPSLNEKIYQRDIDCPETGDLVISGKFSKVLEAWQKRMKRRAEQFSYVWVSEAQMKRQQKYGGVGDIHFHLIANQKLKYDNGKWYDRATFEWLQSLWCDHVGVKSNNSVHVDPLPESINSMPAYLTKYLGKGTQRKILARQFAATRDLTAFKPIKLNSLPDLEPVHVKDITAANGYEVTSYYFNTREVLEQYGLHMLEESKFNVTRMDKNFTQDAIIKRAIRRHRVHLIRHNSDTVPTLN